MEVAEFISLKRSDLDYDMAEGYFTTNPDGVVVIRIKDGFVTIETELQKIGVKGTYSFSDFLCILESPKIN